MKQRLVGAAVLVAVAVIFLPMLIKGPAPDSGVSELSFKIPEAASEASSDIQRPLTPVPAPDTALVQEPTPPEDEAARSDQSGTDGSQNSASSLSADAADLAPEPQQTALPPTALSGQYVVHFAAFATQESADLVVRDLQARQLPAFSEEIQLNGRPAVRVRIGPYATQAEAEIVRVRTAQVRSDVQPRVFMLIDDTAGERTAAALAQTAPASSAAPEVGFVVQLGAFSDTTRAARLQERLRQAGIVAFTDTVNTARGTLIRVNAGPVSSRAEAKQLKARVKSAVDIDGIVRSHP